MFRIGKEFHLLHVVSDLDTVDGWYDEVFAVRRFVRNSMKAAMRKASLVLVGDFVMEPAQPLRRAPGWEKSALGKFYSLVVLTLRRLRRKERRRCRDKLVAWRESYLPRRYLTIKSSSA